MSGNSLAMMPWFPRDFIAATRHLALAERGAYRELLDYQWEMGALPADPIRLARLLAITAAEFEPIWEAIRDKFESTTVGLLNKRLEEHRKKAEEQRDKKVRGAAKTNAKRYGERADIDTLCESHSDALTVSPPSPSPSPSPSLLKNKEKKGDTAAAPPRKPRRVSRETEDPEWLLDFKLVYPVRAGDPDWRGAIGAARARMAEGHTAAEFIAGARRYAAFCEADSSVGSKYVKQASTFLGPGKPFLLPWHAPPKPETAMDRILRANSPDNSRVIEHDPQLRALTG